MKEERQRFIFEDLFWLAAEITIFLTLVLGLAKMGEYMLFDVVSPIILEIQGIEPETDYDAINEEFYR